jgi:hypothetical protein
MRIQIEEIDSLAVGANVLTIKDYSINEDFARFERDYLITYQPRYVACKILATDLPGIHRLESFQFNFVEFQISLTAKVKLYDLTPFPYKFEEATSEEDLASVLEIASSIFTHDRFFVDEAMGKEISSERYRRYVEKSFHAKDEYVHKLSLASGEIVAFVSHKVLDNGEAVLLLGGVKNGYTKTGLGVLNDQFVINELHRKGIKRLSGAFSGINYPVMNMEIGGLGFRVVSTWVVMRKVYPHCGR